MSGGNVDVDMSGDPTIRSAGFDFTTDDLQALDDVVPLTTGKGNGPPVVLTVMRGSDLVRLCDTAARLWEMSLRARYVVADVDGVLQNLMNFVTPIYEVSFGETDPGFEEAVAARADEYLDDIVDAFQRGQLELLQRWGWYVGLIRLARANIISRLEAAQGTTDRSRELNRRLGIGVATVKVTCDVVCTLYGTFGGPGAAGVAALEGVGSSFAGAWASGQPFWGTAVQAGGGGLGYGGEVANLSARQAQRLARLEQTVQEIGAMFDAIDDAVPLKWMGGYQEAQAAAMRAGALLRDQGALARRLMPAARVLSAGNYALCIAGLAQATLEYASTLEAFDEPGLQDAIQAQFDAIYL